MASLSTASARLAKTAGSGFTRLRMNNEPHSKSNPKCLIVSVMLDLQRTWEVSVQITTACKPSLLSFIAISSFKVIAWCIFSWVILWVSIMHFFISLAKIGRASWEPVIYKRKLTSWELDSILSNFTRILNVVSFTLAREINVASAVPLWLAGWDAGNPFLLFFFIFIIFTSNFEPWKNSVNNQHFDMSRLWGKQNAEYGHRIVANAQNIFFSNFVYLKFKNMNLNYYY